MSNEVKTKEKVNMDPKYIIELTLKLFVTCLIVAGLLGATNMVTKDKIAAINLEKTQEAMKAVVADPDNSTFSDALALTDEMTAAALAGGGTLTEAYEVLVGGAPAGHALKIVASGSQGNIEMMVGLDADGAVTGVSVVKHAETAGIGTKVVDNEPKQTLYQFFALGALDGYLSIMVRLIVDDNVVALALFYNPCVILVDV